MYIEVIDDFLPKSYFELISNRITHFSFPWFFKKDITYPNPNFKVNENNDLDSFGFDHFVVEECQASDPNISDLLSGFFGILMDVSKQPTISKCRIDMTIHTIPSYKHTPHVDLFRNHIASVFYLNDSDGNTEIYEEQCYTPDHYNSFDLSGLTLKHEIEPRANRVLLFDGTYLHTGHSPSKTKNRVIINTDLID